MIRKAEEGFSDREKNGKTRATSLIIVRCASLPAHYTCRVCTCEVYFAYKTFVMLRTMSCELSCGPRCRVSVNLNVWFTRFPTGSLEYCLHYFKREVSVFIYFLGRRDTKKKWHSGTVLFSCFPFMFFFLFTRLYNELDDNQCYVIFI